MPKSLREIGMYAFIFCQSLTQVALNEDLAVIGDSAFSCTGLEHIRIPSAVRALSDCAFGGCNNLKAVELQEGLEEVEERCF